MFAADSANPIGEKNNSAEVRFLFVFFISGFVGYVSTGALFADGIQFPNQHPPPPPPASPLLILAELL